jgi:hypothetical protein
MINEININDLIKRIFGDKPKKDISPPARITTPSTSTVPIAPKSVPMSSKTSQLSLPVRAAGQKKSRKAVQPSLFKNKPGKQLSFNLRTPRIVNPSKIVIPKRYNPTNDEDVKRWLDDNFKKAVDGKAIYIGPDLHGEDVILRDLGNGPHTLGLVQGQPVKNPTWDYERLKDQPTLSIMKWNEMVSRLRKKFRRYTKGKFSQNEMTINEVKLIIRELIKENTLQNDPYAKFAATYPELMKAATQWLDKNLQPDPHVPQRYENKLPSEILRLIQKNFEGGVKGLVQQLRMKTMPEIPPTEGIEENYEQEVPDGYSNDSQRAFAMSQSTTQCHNDRRKAEELAKQGKYVILGGTNAHCKATDGVVGQNLTIHSIHDNSQEAQTEIKKIYGDFDFIDLVTPQSIHTPKSHPSYKQPDDKDVPFEEGVGAGNPKDDPKHVKGERWRIKFASEDDLEKHGDTEMSPVNERQEKPDYGAQLHNALRKADKDGNVEAVVYYKQILQNPNIAASVSFEKFKDSWAYEQWLKKSETQHEIEKANDDRKRFSWRFENFKKSDLKNILTEVIEEVWSEISEAQTKVNDPQPLIKNKATILKSIDSLKEGQGIWFSQTQSGNEWEGIWKVAEGDYLTFYRGEHPESRHREELESDKAVEDFVDEIIKSNYNFFIVQNIQGYKKHIDHERDDQSLGEYPFMEPEYPKPEYQNEVAPPGWEGTVKGMKKHKDISNPWALAWSMKNKGFKSHKKK